MISTLSLLLFARVSTGCLAPGGTAGIWPVLARLPEAALMGWAPGPAEPRPYGSPPLLALKQLPPRCSAALAPLGRELLQQALATATPAGAQLELVEWPKGLFPEGDLHFDARALPRLPRTGEIRPVVWRGVLKAGPRQFPVWARVRLWVERERLEVRRPVRAGDLLEADALTTAPAREYPYWPAALTRPEEAAGQQARRTLSPGDTLAARDLAPAPAVRRGDSVVVAAGAGPAKLQVNAVAEAPARTGQIVLVKNPLNGRRFAARITAPGQAEAVATLAKDHP